jgi:hypothetical protein
MTDFEKRLRNDLEPLLSSPDPREKISAYHDMPYALFRYDPEQEFSLRREITMLTTRLTQKGKRVTRTGFLHPPKTTGTKPDRHSNRNGPTRSASMQELRRRLKTACISGKIFFRGNDRSPAGNVSEIGKAVIAVLEQVLPDVYNRFSEASAKKTDVTKGIDALLTAENLSGLSSTR